MELKPCPFCGSKNVSSMLDEGAKLYRIICNDCKTSTRLDYDPENIWNKRSTVQQPPPTPNSDKGKRDSCDGCKHLDKDYECDMLLTRQCWEK